MSTQAGERRSQLVNEFTQAQTSLLLASLPAFIADGYRGARINEIVERADGGGSSTLHRKFGTKKQLYKEVYSFCWREINSLLSVHTFVPTVGDAADQVLGDFDCLAAAFSDEYYNPIITFPLIALRRPEYLDRESTTLDPESTSFPAEALFAQRLDAGIELVREPSLSDETASLREELFVTFQVTWGTWHQLGASKPSADDLHNELKRILENNSGLKKTPSPGPVTASV